MNISVSSRTCADVRIDREFNDMERSNLYQYLVDEYDFVIQDCTHSGETTTLVLSVPDPRWYSDGTVGRAVLEAVKYIEAANSIGHLIAT